MFPLSGCNSGFAKPFVNVIVFPPAKLTAESAEESGVPVALEVPPVTVPVPENKFKPPVELNVPYPLNFSCW